ncbi:AIPR family protein [Solidesulfovibrio magneticus]|uniref:Abortive phage infection protein C-terminal domain-containing protein n=1 Tax=Solidesulfovibrio magneticus (strain ATCC 700980 / DSM 13731 / RS-1) TaxID=573370 RepID=C4XTQ5_SOLM1|nr:AIPR family protein [Solidesulfovibrio magneticus]BAH73570.1 hypothetical protein DMR_00790 [Solidesulfovibrio magneticus RS-1]
MHRIVKAHLDSFVKKFSLESDDEASQFEKFVNYSIVTTKIGTQYDIDDITTSTSDDGCDGIAVIINEEVVVSEEDVRSFFITERRNHDVEIVFIQAKRSESYDLGDFLKFKESILRFLTSEPYAATDDVQQEARKMFDVIIENVPKLRNGKPSAYIRYVGTGMYQCPSSLETAKSDFVRQLDDVGFFKETDIQILGRDELTSLWVGTYSGAKAKLEMLSNAPLRTIDGINEAYLAVVKAADFVNELLVNENGDLRLQVFEENVRSFLGNENAVNRSIAETLQNPRSASRFPVLNNGITIVSPDVQVQGTTLHLKNYQIVNGCQTSNVLFENRDYLTNEVMVNLKVVETTNEDIFSELVRATNSQTTIEETQFVSLKPIVKKIEQYFNTYETTESRLYLERRERQYVGSEIPAIRIFSVHTVTRCVAAMFCQRPDLSFKYPKKMYLELSDTIFMDNNKEILYYAACLTLYRLHLLVSNRTIPQSMKRFKWHILLIVRILLSSKEPIRLNSSKVEDVSQKMISIFSLHNETATEIFKKAVDVIESFGSITNDRLKGQLIIQEMLSKT